MNAPPTFPTIPPMPAVARILSRFQRDQLASFIEVAIGLLDIADPDHDLEDNGDDELTGDEQDAAWTEHHTRGRHKLASGMSEPFADHEDDEEDDSDTSVEDSPRGFDPEQDYGGEEAGECEQMAQDVPTVPCFAIEPSDDGNRAFVGYWNTGTFVGDPGPSLAS